MRTLAKLFENNRAWAAKMLKRDPQFFHTLVNQQAPEYLWIGCSDSRVPANEIVGLLPGELFVHRNVANLLVDGDVNGHSVLEYAVESLKVKHVIVCGHYGCGGVHAAASGATAGLIDGWLSPLRAINARHRERLGALDETARIDVLCELNVVEQARNVCRAAVVQDAWRQGRPLAVHGWIYALDNGLLRDLGLTATHQGDAASFDGVVEKILARG